MNKHIELVKKWLADPKSASKAELEANSSEALAADLLLGLLLLVLLIYC